ncbi:unnamed protein product [Lactuca saligna]|uniref:Uncharacterized protein n=1 Tax=Lactuca saligna TaxID=75948 RepID=A0AA36EJ94_LACSI|nr:unnamed protein product [Lactuca saligna]
MKHHRRQLLLPFDPLVELIGAARKRKLELQSTATHPACCHRSTAAADKFRPPISLQIIVPVKRKLKPGGKRPSELRHSPTSPLTATVAILRRHFRRDASGKSSPSSPFRSDDSLSSIQPRTKRPNEQVLFQFMYL